jgi:hypothetical protein
MEAEHPGAADLTAPLRLLLRAAAQGVPWNPLEHNGGQR